MTATTVHDRFQFGISWREGVQLIGDVRGSRRSLRAALIAAASTVTANQAENYGAWVYDVMAHPGKPQLWRLCRSGVKRWVVAERR